MSLYVTPAQLASGPDTLNELAELHYIAPDLLRATIDNGDRSGWDAADVQAANAALASILQRCLEAGGEVDARLVKRGYAVPMDPLQFPILIVWARAIARYHLHPQRDRTSEDTGRVERDYRDAIRALDAVAAGNLSLGAGDPLAVNDVDPDAGGVRMSSQPRRFSRTTLAGL